MQRLGAQGRIVMSVRGRTSADEILAEIGSRLLAKAIEFGLPEEDPNHRLAVDVRRPDLAAAERFERLSTRLFADMPLVFLLDDFDVNLRLVSEHYEIVSGELAALLDAWVASPGRTRLAVTSRHRFSLRGCDGRHLTQVELGLPRADEAERLCRQLPTLAALKAGDRRRICQTVGGHPLALRCADALAKEDAVALPEAELAPDEAGRFFLGRLLERLGGPVAIRLLLGASVYRQPVDDVALLWQVGEESQQDPALADRVRAFHEAIEAVRNAGQDPTPAQLGMSDEEFVEALSDLEEWTRPPLTVPDGFGAARDQLRRVGLLVGRSTGGSTQWMVDRWTADRLASLVDAAELRQAHRRAARNWRFRVQRVTEDVAEALAQLLEARYHWQRAGELAEAFETTDRVCDQLEGWGAHVRVRELCLEALGWSDEPSRYRSVLLLHLGLAEERLGELDEAQAAVQEAGPDGAQHVLELLRATGVASRHRFRQDPE